MTPSVNICPKTNDNPDQVRKKYFDTPLCFLNLLHILLLYNSAQCRGESRIAQDLQSSNFCREEEELRQNVEEWVAATQRLELIMNELVSLEIKLKFEDNAILL